MSLLVFQCVSRYIYTASGSQYDYENYKRQALYFGIRLVRAIIRFISVHRISIRQCSYSNICNIFSSQSLWMCHQYTFAE